MTGANVPHSIGVNGAWIDSRLTIRSSGPPSVAAELKR